MLYGHIETFEHRVDHLLRLRALQDETGGLQAFIPLAFHPDGNGMKNLPAPTAIDDLRTLAVSRLMLDNVDHLKAYWVSMTPKIAQVGLRFGADDLDGTIVHETIYRAAGSRSPDGLRYDELVRLIREAGRIPVERDTLYNVVRELPAQLVPESALKVKDRNGQRHLAVLE
jgi:aminodeoxyfutalosine synthase